jgi:phosphinothricin acetyltransferase
MLIRLATPADAAAVAAIYAPYVCETAACFEVVPPDAAELARRIREVGAAYPWLVAEQEGEILGYAYGTRHRPRRAYQWCTEVSVYVRRSGHRTGIGRRLYQPLLELLRLQGFINAYAVITLPNPGSVAFHEGLGFRHFTVFPAIGYKLGCWHDVGWYVKVLAPHPSTPADPLPMAELLDLTQARQLLVLAGQA